MARLREKIWDNLETTAAIVNEMSIEEKKPVEHELIDVHQDLTPIEPNRFLMKRKRINQTSVRITTIEQMRRQTTFFFSSVDLDQNLIDINFRSVLIYSIKLMKWLEFFRLKQMLNIFWCLFIL